MEQFDPQVAQFQLTATNWRGVIYSLMVTSRKYWDDNYFWNVDVVDALRIFDTKYTAKFEILLLNLSDFKMYVDNDEFQDYFDMLYSYH